MEICIIILSFIIVLLLSYLFFIKKELKRISKSIEDSHNSESNTLINSELDIKELRSLIFEINKILKREKEISESGVRHTKNLNNMMLNISHDLRTPLTSALGYTNILLESNHLKKDELEDAKIIKERLERLEELIDSFFMFSKIANDEENIKLESINIISVLEESIISFYDDFKNEKRVINLNKSIDKCFMIANKDVLMRIFDNLIGNAYKHSVSDLNIDISVEDEINIIFSNKILDKNIDVNYIFDEFYTIDISRTKENTGLGLAIVKRFTILLKGSIKAEVKKSNLIITLNFKKL